MSKIVIIPPGETVSLGSTDSGFAHGFGLFETMRYADGRLYFWKDHWARLTRSAKQFALALPAESAVLLALRELVTSARIEASTLKLSLLKEATGSRLYVYARPAIPAPEGRRLQLDTTCPIFSRSLLAGHKTHNYMEAMYLLSLARAQGFYDTLRVDAAGRLAETTSSNLFFVKDGRLHTPALDVGILPGVTRAALLSVREFEVEEGHYSPEVLLEAEAVFVSNATVGLQSIQRIDGFPGRRSAEYQTPNHTFFTLQSALQEVQVARSLPLFE